MEDLFVHTLRDIYYAEKQIVKALPEMAGKASDPQLKQGFHARTIASEGVLRRRSERQREDTRRDRSTVA